MKKIRLDELLVQKGFFSSRERAKAAVMEGCVYIGEKKETKPGTQVSPETEPTVRGEALPYVSRGGFKLAGALEAFSIDVSGLKCVDCGASTGGFTDVLLKNGAEKVYAVDVGYGQLAWSLRTDERVINIERTNVRYLSSEIIPEELDLAVMDLAFISIKLVIPAVRTVLKKAGRLICLIKPQFEAGRENVGKKGVIKNPDIHERVLTDMLDFFYAEGLSLLGLYYSPIRGPEGNIEYLAYLGTDGEESITPDIPGLVAASHNKFEK